LATDIAARPKETRYLELITGLFAGFILISNLASTRIVKVGFLEFDAGTLMFPFTYIFGDVLTEVYGFAKSRKVIWTGFLTLFLATVLLWVASLFPAAPGWEGDAAWLTVMGLVPRLAIASLIAYLIGEFANSITLAKMKAKRPNKGPAFRFIASTLVGQFFDTILFASVAFLGVLDSGLWWKLVGSNYLFKVGVEIILLPLTILVVRKIKKTEGLDAVDREISFNPFSWRDAAAKEEAPAKDEAAKEEAPVKDEAAKEEAPAKDVAAKEEAPAKDVAAKEEAAIKDVAAKEEAPGETPAPEAIDAANKAPKEEVPKEEAPKDEPSLGLDAPIEPNETPDAPEATLAKEKE
jgi:uncharacterized integral membrane protein (TIGR00697 family)